MQTDCPACHGTGKTTQQDAGWDTPPRRVPCDQCDGTGDLDAHAAADWKTGR